MSNILKDCYENIQQEPKQPTSPEQIMQVMKLLKRHLFDFVIAGGYARDKFYGKEPKDCDICTFNFHQDDPAESRLLLSLLDALADLTDVRMCQAYDDDDKRLGNVIKLDSWNIDIIFYANAKSAWDVLSQFDCNMNQFYIPGSIPDYNGGGTCEWTGDQVYAPLELDSPVFYGSGDEPAELVYIASGDLTPRRIVKMGEKWTAYTGKELTGESKSLYFDALCSLNQDLPF